ncbi:hypothetical protein [Chryseosolibacter indicus]|uniref:Uncharacterized protein n=1 Tax=Chryseosolibacter indicus TaxID=2782351 RepID=A0ABS5VYN2_9BACT|nr:hypothetical protein [Chryseosolibacter indicus]MBT1706527.1 hypothetical protein [Chryseosolibacter indicus]
MIDIVLESGRKVTVDGFVYGRTYSGLLEGSPNLKSNKRILDWQKCPSEWGPRKVLMLEPSSQALQSWLPPSTYKVWLTSNDPINKTFMGSELVVIWFDENPGQRSIKEIIENGIRKVDWDNNAKDFDY